MNYKETGFRAFYHHFCSLPLSEKTAKCIEGFPRAEEANAYLTYGYIDSEAGLTLEVVAAAKVSDEGIILHKNVTRYIHKNSKEDNQNEK